MYYKLSVNQLLLTIRPEILSRVNTLDLNIPSSRCNDAVNSLLQRTVLLGGKRLRPLLTYLMGDLFSLPLNRIDLAARGCDGAVEFSVTDTGFGIPTAEMERILRPFEQLDNDLTRAHEGTGLGLTMCQSLMELHGGSLGIESTEGQGTTVTFSFTQATA